MSSDHDTLDFYQALGFIQVGVSGSEVYGECPVCNKNKLYINSNTGRWDCKVCGRGGSQSGYLQMYLEQCKEEIDQQPALKELAEFRGLSFTTLWELGVVWDGDMFWFPHFGQKGQLLTAQTYRIPKPGNKSRMMNLKKADGFSPQLWGLDRYDPKKKINILVEGFWDAAAVLEMLSNDDYEKYNVLAVPGANSWKDLWNQYVGTGEELWILFDNDKAGVDGAARIEKMVSEKLTIRRLQWSEQTFEHADVRDLLLNGSEWDDVKRMVVSTQASPAAPVQQDFRQSWDELMKDYETTNHFEREQRRVVRLICGTILSHHLGHDPLWLHIVGPAGGGKTRFLSSVQWSNQVHFLSSIGAATLVSGFQTHGGRDPSLLPKLDGKYLVLKDFTEVLELPLKEKEQIYSILRGAYDGHVRREYGNGVVRDYRVKFGIITGVTPVIYNEASESLGERFLKYRMGSMSDEEKTGLMSAILDKRELKQSKNQEKEDRLLQQVANFLDYPVDVELLPAIDSYYRKKLIALSQFTAYMRTRVQRDSRHRDRITSENNIQYEIGTRLLQQFANLFQGMALLESPYDYSDEDFAIVRHCAFSSCNARYLRIFDILSKHPYGLSSKELTDHMLMPSGSLKEDLEDMHILGTVEKIGGTQSVATWTVSETAREQWLSIQD